jgi:hypothetical protein
VRELHSDHLLFPKAHQVGMEELRAIIRMPFSHRDQIDFTMARFAAIPGDPLRYAARQNGADGQPWV